MSSRVEVRRGELVRFEGLVGPRGKVTVTSLLLQAGRGGEGRRAGERAGASWDLRSESEHE